MANDSFPMLVRDRLDYREGAYEVSVTRAPQGAGMVVRHRVSGRNLVAELLKRSEAAFAVEVSGAVCNVPGDSTVRSRGRG